MHSIIIHSGQGHGKTSAAPALMRHFGCAELIEEWDGRTRLPERSLVLTNLRRAEFHVPPGATVLGFTRALTLL